MKLYTEQDRESVLVPASFIDTYMASANGEFVKVYLYLLRHLGSRTEFSLASAADMLECTENDIRRAVQYWSKQGLLRITKNGSGEWTELYVVDVPPAPVQTENRKAFSAQTEIGKPFPAQTDNEKALHTQTENGRAFPAQTENGKAFSSQTRNENASHAPDAAAPAAKADPLKHVTEKKETAGRDPGPEAEKVPDPVRISKARVEELAGQEEVRQLFYVAGQYMERPLSSTEQEDLLYYYDVLHFPMDLIEYLLEYCISKGSASRHYIRKVALEWYKAGVKNRAQAKKESSLFNKDYFAIMKAFGLKGRYPAPQEQELMAHWINGLGFSMELILEACSRTILQTHEASFPYTNSILEGWKKQEVRTLADVAVLDAAHHARQKETARKPQTGNAGNADAQAGASTRFHNFNQREYDYDNLERQLLQAE